VEVDEDGEGGGGGGGGDEDTEPEVAGWVDGDVGGVHAINDGGVGRSVAVNEFKEATVDGVVGAARGVADGGEKKNG